MTRVGYVAAVRGDDLSAAFGRASNDDPLMRAVRDLATEHAAGHAEHAARGSKATARLRIVILPMTPCQADATEIAGLLVQQHMGNPATSMLAATASWANALPFADVDGGDVVGWVFFGAAESAPTSTTGTTAPARDANSAEPR